MKFNKIMRTALCVAILAALLAGCSSGEHEQWYLDGEQSTSTPPPSGTSQAPSPVSPFPTGNSGMTMLEDIDFETAYATYPHDTVMIRVGEYVITWEELFFNLRGALNYINSMLGMLPSLSDTLMDGSTYAETMMLYAVDNALLYKGLEHGASLQGIELNDEDYEQIKIELEEIITIYSGKDTLLQVLWETDGIKRFEFFEYLYKTGYMSNVMFERTYGVDGVLMTDEELAELTASDGLLMAKHILRMKTEEGDETPLNESIDILNLLNAYSGDDFGAYFDELMIAHSEDSGLIYFPDGYLFQANDMMPEFSNACISLDIGSFSEIVETTYGYHIIYRLPLNYDAIPSSNASSGDMRSLRSIIAMNLFDTLINSWIDMLTPEYTAEFDSIDVASVFS